jgi:hypothetical protein
MQKSEKILEAESKDKILDYKYLPLGSKPKEFEGATRYYQVLKKKFPKQVKITVSPSKLNFEKVEQ